LNVTQETPRILDYVLKNAGTEAVERRQKYQYQSGTAGGYTISYESSATDATAIVQLRGTGASVRRESVRVEFTDEAFTDYCVSSSYQANGQLEYQAVQLLKPSTSTCDEKMTVMYVYHEFRRLS